MNADFINGCFESASGVAVFIHCLALLRDKQIKGYSPAATLFFSFWGVWNLYYYPHLHQPWSFCGGIIVFSANVLWVMLVIRYRYMAPAATLTVK